jgi:hypothetical protein
MTKLKTKEWWFGRNEAQRTSVYLDTKREAKEVRITFQHWIKSHETKGVECVHSFLRWLVFGSAVDGW